jgi:phage virion morphogenesis protein
LPDDFAPIADLAGALLRNVAGPARRTLLRQVAREGQQANRTRIAGQVQPDGTPFEPRRAKPTKKGRIRQKAMFRKLRLARYLKAGSTENQAWIGFNGRAAAVARIHQDGLADAPARGQAKVRYARRVLLGLSDADRERVMDLLLDHVTSGI